MLGRVFFAGETRTLGNKCCPVPTAIFCSVTCGTSPTAATTRHF